MRRKDRRGEDRKMEEKKRIIAKGGSEGARNEKKRVR